MEKATEPSDMDDPPPAYAMQYIRTSGTHEQHSTENQLNAIRRYAELHKLEIVGTFSDQSRASLAGLVDK
jgi:DNA invertase Pin-like site-specific DNA recombinase